VTGFEGSTHLDSERGNPFKGIETAGGSSLKGGGKSTRVIKAATPGLGLLSRMERHVNKVPEEIVPVENRKLPLSRHNDRRQEVVKGQRIV